MEHHAKSALLTGILAIGLCVAGCVATSSAALESGAPGDEEWMTASFGWPWDYNRATEAARQFISNTRGEKIDIEFGGMQPRRFKGVNGEWVYAYRLTATVGGRYEDREETQREYIPGNPYEFYFRDGLIAVFMSESVAKPRDGKYDRGQYVWKRLSSP